MPLRVVFYVRYSSDKQNESSLDDQSRLCREYAMSKGWLIVEVYGDPELTGRNTFRPEYQRMMLDAAAGKFDVVVTEAIDRLSRRLADVSDLYDRLHAHGIELHTPHLGQLTDVHIAIGGLFAQMYSKELGEKVKRGQAGRVAKGKVPAGLAYGYKALPPVQSGNITLAGDREIVTEEADIVRRIFADYAGGKSPETIARELNLEGVPGPRGRPWRNTSIRGQGKRATGLLRNRLYVGQILWDRCSYKTLPGKKGRVARPKDQSEWVIGDAPHLRIIDDALWERVQDRLTKVAEKATASRRTIHNGGPGRDVDLNATHRPKFLLAGLMKCSCCGSNYTMVGKDRYGCANRNRGTGTCTNSKTIKRQVVEERVLACMRDRLMVPDLVAQFVKDAQAEYRKAKKEAADEESKLRKQLSSVDRALVQLLILAESGSAPATILNRISERETEKADLQFRLDDLTADRADVLDLLPNLHDVYARKVANLMDTLNAPEIKLEATELLRGLIDKVDMIPDATAPNGMAMNVHGELARILAFCHGADAKTKLPGFYGPGSQVSVVAGVGFEPTTFRL